MDRFVFALGFPKAEAWQNVNGKIGYWDHNVEKSIICLNVYKCGTNILAAQASQGIVFGNHIFESWVNLEGSDLYRSGANLKGFDHGGSNIEVIGWHKVE